MRKKDELSLENTCMSHGHPEEMVFVLLGRDPAAPLALRAWADERVRLGKNTHTDVQITEAREIADTMELEGRRWVDVPRDAAGPTRAELTKALDESVKLQSHYATLLNQYDGGERVMFADSDDWIRRLSDIKCSHVHVVRGEDAPRVYGSWRTQVCLDCGAFREHGHNDRPVPSRPWPGHDWRPASEYEDAVAKREDD